MTRTGTVTLQEQHNEQVREKMQFLCAAGRPVVVTTSHIWSVGSRIFIFGVAMVVKRIATQAEYTESAAYSNRSGSRYVSPDSFIYYDNFYEVEALD